MDFMVVLAVLGAVFSKVNYLNNSIYVKGDKVYGIYLYEYSGSTQGTTCISTLNTIIFMFHQLVEMLRMPIILRVLAIPYYNFDYTLLSTDEFGIYHYTL